MPLEQGSPPDIVAHAKVLEVAVVLEHVDCKVQRASFPGRCRIAEEVNITFRQVGITFRQASYSGR